jgi:prepilin-type N-terminal cleavage/methylation domain-containing protein
MIRRARKRFGGQGGFTLFEVIMVLLILGVISYFAATRLFTDDVISRVSEVDLVKNHLRYAQSRAMNSEMSWGIKFESSNRYCLVNTTDEVCGDGKLLLPGIDASDGVVVLRSLQVTPPSGNKVTFDPFGSPGPATITLSTTAGNIIITENTGFIP